MMLFRRSGLSALLLISVSVLITGCSDDGPKPVLDLTGVDGPSDAAVDSATDMPSDASVDANVEQGVDAAKDAASDATPTDASGEATVDASLDAAAPKEAGFPDGSGLKPSVWGYITRSAALGLDGKGTIYIGLYLRGLPPPAFQVASTSVVADLSAPGAKVRYELFNAAPGDYDVWGFLDDNGNAFPLLPTADAGDLLPAKVKPVKVGATPVQVDVDFDLLAGGLADGGQSDAIASLGILRGKIRSTAKHVHDGKGNIYISLHSALPPAGQILATQINAGDLSSQFSAEPYFLSGVKAGRYYLSVYMDDNNNVNIFAPGPDKTDLIHSKPIQVRVVAGTITTQDIALDSVK